MNETCPACGSSSWLVVASTPRVDVARCGSCRTAFIVGPHVQGHLDLYNRQAAWDDFAEAQNAPALRERHRAVLDRLHEMKPTGRVFDIGAGGGRFLATARERGYAVAGNEVSTPAIDACWVAFGVELHYGDDLTALPAGSQDIVTMWCVIAHADDPAALLADTRHLLAPDGVLYFHTPRWCLIDTIGLLLGRLGGRFGAVTARRIGPKHRRIYTTHGLRVQLERAGFEVLDMRAIVAFGFHAHTYLEQMGVPRPVARPVGRLVDRLAAARLLPRNTIEVYATPVR